MVHCLLCGSTYSVVYCANYPRAIAIWFYSYTFRPLKLSGFWFSSSFSIYYYADYAVRYYDDITHPFRAVLRCAFFG